MIWRKLGLICSAPKACPWAHSHATTPTPYLLDDEIIRVFVTGMDAQGRGRPGFVDLAADDPRKVLAVSSTPLLELGASGCFDDNGVMVVSALNVGSKTIYLYYVGFELCTHIPYRMFTGLAISHDDGASFTKYGQTPILDRTNEELYFRCGPFVMLDDGRFKLWYIAGSKWEAVGGKMRPVYDLRYQESKDGINWAKKGKVSISITGVDEHGFGRPWIVKRAINDYQLFYSIRRRSCAAYRLGYAESKDGIHWDRKDLEMGLDISPGQFDSDAIMYSSVITVKGRTYCFYNGNNFGEQGFGVAELVG